MIALKKIIDRQKLKRFLPDGAVLLMMVAMAAIFAGRPQVSVEERPRQPAAVQAQAPAATNAAAPLLRRPVEEDKFLKARNIFSATGTYEDPDKPPIPKNPYNLIAVLQGKEKKAVFRDYQGKVSTLETGKEMLDKFVIVRIDNASVQLAKGEEKKELRLFNAGGGHLLPAEEDKDEAVSKKNLYVLTGILGGRVKKAVFRDYRGKMLLLGVGATLNDGAVIAGIDSVSVRVDKDGERKVLKLFDAQNSEQSIRKKKKND